MPCKKNDNKDLNNSQIKNIKPQTRQEKDALGIKDVPEQAYFGIQTMRAVENFPISGIREHPEFIKAFAYIKIAAAKTNCEIGLLDTIIADAIIKASNEIANGNFNDQFVVDVFQAGAGTSFHMNINEVIANRSCEILGGKKGDYHLVHPNDHVNMGQSTNDVFPTAMRLSSIVLTNHLLIALSDLVSAFREKGNEFKGIIKSGRTHLQDAVPIQLGQEFNAYAVALSKACQQIKQAKTSLEELGIGGSAVGTGLNTHPDYRNKVIQYLCELTGIKGLKPTEDMCEAMQSNLCIAQISSSLKLLSLELTRIANDLRLLSSGPTTGLSEINLPPVQPGSSMMPGKVNPVMAEVLNMVAFQVIGNDQTISLAVSAGQLELNVMMPVMIYNLLQSLEILTNVLIIFNQKCVQGITPNPQRCKEYVERSLALATALNPYIGYQATAELVKESLKTNIPIVDLLRQKNLLSQEQIYQILDPIKMTSPCIARVNS